MIALALTRYSSESWAITSICFSSSDTPPDRTRGRVSIRFGQVACFTAFMPLRYSTPRKLATISRNPVDRFVGMCESMGMTVFHGTSQEFTDTDLALSYDAALDSGYSLPAPALFVATDRAAAEYFATGCEIEQGATPRVIELEIDEARVLTIAARNDGEAEDWMVDHEDEIQDGEIAAITWAGIDHSAIVIFDAGMIRVA